MDISLPKQLEYSLKKLLSEFGLSGWSIHGSLKTTTVVLRFKMEDTVDSADRDQDIKYKRISPSQMARDEQRAKLHRASEPPTSYSQAQAVSEVSPPDSVIEEDTICKQVDTAAPTMCDPPTILQVKPKIKSPQRITRSKSKVTPSPIPQVDGHVEANSALVLHGQRISNVNDIPDWLTELLEEENKRT